MRNMLEQILSQKLIKRNYNNFNKKVNQLLFLKKHKNNLDN